MPITETRPAVAITLTFTFNDGRVSDPYYLRVEPTENWHGVWNLRASLPGPRFSVMEELQEMGEHGPPQDDLVATITILDLEHVFFQPHEPISIVGQHGEWIHLPVSCSNTRLQILVNPDAISKFSIRGVPATFSVARDPPAENCHVLESVDINRADDEDEQQSGEEPGDELGELQNLALVSTTAGNESEGSSGSSSGTIKGTTEKSQTPKTTSLGLFVGDSHIQELASIYDLQNANYPDLEFAANLVKPHPTDSQMTEAATQSQSLVHFIGPNEHLKEVRETTARAVIPNLVEDQETSNFRPSEEIEDAEDKMDESETAHSRAPPDMSHIIIVNETEPSSDTEDTSSIYSTIELAPKEQEHAHPRKAVKKKATKGKGSPQQKKAKSAYSGHGIQLRVLLSSSSSLDSDSQTMKKLKKHGIDQVENVEDCEVFCVGKDTQIAKSARLLEAVILGKHIVTDDWLENSASAGIVYDRKRYLVEDLNIKKACEKFRKGCSPFATRKIIFTPALKHGMGKTYEDYETLAALAGANDVLSASVSEDLTDENALWISKENDPSLVTLASLDIQCYSKELITNSILRANLDIDTDEFRLSAPTECENLPKKRKLATEHATAQFNVKKSRITVIV